VIEEGALLVVGGNSCEPVVDECASNPCQNGGTCTDLFTGPGGFSCDCEGTGFDGATCADDVDDCQPNDPCLHGGKCVDSGVNSYFCDCNFPLPDGSGHTGTHCEIDVDDCLSGGRGFGKCQNGGECVDDGVFAFACDCTDTGFAGRLCADPFVDCATTDPCLHDGVCVDMQTTRGFYCDCSVTGYNGTVCDFLLESDDTIVTWEPESGAELDVYEVRTWTCVCLCIYKLV
jgi:hypothetical protein